MINIPKLRITKTVNGWKLQEITRNQGVIFWNSRYSRPRSYGYMSRSNSSNSNGTDLVFEFNIKNNLSRTVLNALASFGGEVTNSDEKIVKDQLNNKIVKQYPKNDNVYMLDIIKNILYKKYYEKLEFKGKKDLINKINKNNDFIIKHHGFTR